MFWNLIPSPLAVLLNRFREFRATIFSFLVCVPTSIFALLLLSLLAYNGASVFYVRVPFLAPEPASISRQNHPGLASLSSSSLSYSSLMYVVREQNSPLFLNTHFPNLHQKPELSLGLPNVKPAYSAHKRKRIRRLKRKLRNLSSKEQITNHNFSSRMKDFFDTGRCEKPRFFMTWISSLDSFGERESFSIESLFKTHPESCLAIVSRAMDSEKGNEILKPFLKSGFKVIAVSPDYGFVFKNTPAEAWFNQLRGGRVDPGEIALGQNLSNLLRLCILYKYGGVYADTDMIFLKSFSNLRNAVGAQTIDLETGNWSRLNNAVLVFDKHHPLLLEFIREFALTFDGNKWGYNGPYLVSRVVSRLPENPGFEYTVLPPIAFYPVDWSRIRGLFRCPDGDELHRKWRIGKLTQILSGSYAVHLWNRQSKSLRVENGSVIDHIKKGFCVYCDSMNASSSSSLSAST